MAGPYSSVSHDPEQPYNQAILVDQKEAFQNKDGVLLSPRLSFAWQPLGVTHNAVLRGGIGIFYDPVPGNVAATFSTNPPLSNSYTIVGDNLTPKEQTSLFKDAAASNAAFLNGFAAGQTLAQIQDTISRFYPPGFSPPAITLPPARMHFPQFQRWSLEWQQSFGADTSLSIGYFGNHGIHELVQDPNVNAYGFGSLPASLCSNPPVPPCADPRFSGVTQVSADAVSNYNGMIVSFQRRFAGWGQGLFQVNYTFSHAFDEVSNGGLMAFTYGSALSPQDPNDLRGAYGPAEYDVRHSLNANYVWEPPLEKHYADTAQGFWWKDGRYRGPFSRGPDSRIPCLISSNPVYSHHRITLERSTQCRLRIPFQGTLVARVQLLRAPPILVSPRNSWRMGNRIRARISCRPAAKRDLTAETYPERRAHVAVLQSRTRRDEIGSEDRRTSTLISQS